MFEVIKYQLIYFDNYSINVHDHNNNDDAHFPLHHYQNLHGHVDDVQ